MSDLPPPQPSSVVIDSNASVKVPKLPQLVGGVVAAVFVVYFVLALALGGPDAYEPGPAAAAMQTALDRLESDRDLTNDEMRCLDDAAAGIDPALIERGAVDPLSVTSMDVDPEVAAFRIAALDECLASESRVALLVASMSEGSEIPADQAECVSVQIDEAIMAAGGYAELERDPEGSMGMVMGVLMPALAECGADLSDLMGS